MRNLTGYKPIMRFSVILLLFLKTGVSVHIRKQLFLKLNRLKIYSDQPNSNYD